jgi:hypothetical protein
MSGSRRTFTAEFKQEAVQLVARQGLSVSEVAGWAMPTATWCGTTITLHDEEAQRHMRRLDLLGTAGQQRPGFQGAATKKEVPRQESDPTIAS